MRQAENGQSLSCAALPTSSTKECSVPLVPGQPLGVCPTWSFRGASCAAVQQGPGGSLPSPRFSH